MRAVFICLCVRNTFMYYVICMCLNVRVLKAFIFMKRVPNTCSSTNLTVYCGYLCPVSFHISTSTHFCSAEIEISLKYHLQQMFSFGIMTYGTCSKLELLPHVISIIC
jgi:hypothetical protein